MKHNVLSADARTKFIVIASACRCTESAASNMMRTAQANREVASLGRTVKAMEIVTGFYAEQGQEGTFEQSLAIGVDSHIAVKALKNLFCGKYNQECILVWNRDTGAVWLYNGRGCLAQLGTNGLYRSESSIDTALERGRILPDAYTVAADGSVWEVR